MFSLKLYTTNLFKTKFILSNEGLYLIINNKYYYSKYQHVIVDIKSNIEIINKLLLDCYNNYDVFKKILQEELINIDDIIFIKNNIIIYTNNYIFEMDKPFSYIN
jgi:hypothetical protein